MWVTKPLLNPSHNWAKSDTAIPWILLINQIHQYLPHLEMCSINRTHHSKATAAILLLPNGGGKDGIYFLLLSFFLLIGFEHGHHNRGLRYIKHVSIFQCLVLFSRDISCWSKFLTKKNSHTPIFIPQHTPCRHPSVRPLPSPQWHINTRLGWHLSIEGGRKQQERAQMGPRYVISFLFSRFFILTNVRLNM